MDTSSTVQRIVDGEHLKLLTIFHWIQGGLTALFSLIPVIHLVFGLLILSGKFPPAATHTPHPPEEVPRFIGAIFAGFAAVFICVGQAFAVLTLFSARCLGRRRNRTFSLVVAGVNCLLIPFGTVLGVFTILVLSRPSVVALYQDVAGSKV